MEADVVSDAEVAEVVEDVEDVEVDVVMELVVVVESVLREENEGELVADADDVDIVVLALVDEGRRDRVEGAVLSVVSDVVVVDVDTVGPLNAIDPRKEADNMLCVLLCAAAMSPQILYTAPAFASSPLQVAYRHVRAASPNV